MNKCFDSLSKCEELSHPPSGRKRPIDLLICGVFSHFSVSRKNISLTDMRKWEFANPDFNFWQFVWVLVAGIGQTVIEWLVDICRLYCLWSGQLFYGFYSVSSFYERRSLCQIINTGVSKWVTHNSLCGKIQLLPQHDILCQDMTLLLKFGTSLIILQKSALLNVQRADLH